MPFQSEKQRRYMHANLPDIANRWEAKYGLGGIAELNSQLNSLPEYYLPKNQGGRIGFDKGLKVLPKIDITQTESTPAEGIDVSERDITYGLEGLLQGDNLYAGGEFQTGNVKVDVQKEGETLFKDTLSKDDLYNLYIGLGQKEGDRVEVGTDRKGNYTFNIVKSFNQGGLIPSHEAGIYGLAEGGVTDIGFSKVKPSNDGSRPGYFTAQYGGEDKSTSSQDNSPGHPANQPSYSAPDTKTAPDLGGHTRFEPGSGYYGEPVTPREAPPGEKGGAGYISPEDLKKLEFKELIDRQNLEKTEKWEQAQKWQKPNPLWTALKWIGTGAAVIGSGGAALGLGGNKIVQAAQLINKVNKLSNTAVKGYNFINKTNFTRTELFNKIQNDAKTVKETDTAEQDLINSLPRGHPERIQLEELKKETPDDVPDRDGVTQETSIKIENIEEVNDDKTQLLKKYEEMNEASILTRKRQEAMQAKKEAYLRNFRNTYVMAAQGGRIPGGYNTGGLSNLFRLKNR